MASTEASPLPSAPDVVGLPQDYYARDLVIDQHRAIDKFVVGISSLLAYGYQCAIQVQDTDVP
jgi:hypothetical protein